MNTLTIRSGALIDAIHFTTNQGRDFRAGGGGGGPNLLTPEGRPVKVVALSGGLGGHLHNISCHYLEM
jgi:hypothetical protein